MFNPLINEHLFYVRSVQIIIHLTGIWIKKINNLKTKIKKGPGLAISIGLTQGSRSQARSHYCTTRGLLAAGFPPWPGSPLLGQPGYPGLPQGTHIDAMLSADARSTRNALHQNSRPQTIRWTRPPSSWITGDATLPVECLTTIRETLSSDSRLLLLNFDFQTIYN